MSKLAPATRSLFWATGSMMATWLVTGTIAAAAPTEGQAPATATAAVDAKETRTLGVLLYPRFELLDVYGPVEMFGNLGKRMKIVMVAENAGPVTSAQGPQVVAEYGFADCPQLDLLMVPGGFGTLTELKNEALLDWLRAVGQGRNRDERLFRLGAIGQGRPARRASRDLEQEMVSAGRWQRTKCRVGQRSPLGRRSRPCDIVGRFGRHGYGAGRHCPALRLTAGRANRRRHRVPVASRRERRSVRKVREVRTRQTVVLP